MAQEEDIFQAANRALDSGETVETTAQAAAELITALPPEDWTVQSIEYRLTHKPSGRTCDVRGAV